MAFSFTSPVFPGIVHRGAGKKKISQLLFIFIFYPLKVSTEYMFYNEHSALIVYSLKLHAQKYCNQEGQNPKILPSLL